MNALLGGESSRWPASPSSTPRAGYLSSRTREALRKSVP
jgi:hypothetical protein